MQIPYRIGFGYDVHRLEEGYDLWLGGIKIPYEKGLAGHSDADVLLHAVCDALLGAAALGDIGVHFPPTDMAYKGIDSKILLKKTCELIRQAGYEIGNIDATIAAEAPKINPHIPQMKTIMAEVMGLTSGEISIKATTTERLGFVGHREGMEAYATALIMKRQ
ncbi:2-C-methyl-D-erythritol 2,4-cyclodiphosphate synthase [Porphyromonas catoniae]|jgi:ygbB family|uniref:2-C-methyl-D-erythritol 2,4-cyclodiphosphate synthase n=1 Tax=Porphyromonas catoniae ATCC 51270 TaxID=887901 RepID=Z4WT34_9PORP|nr:2-C-methyl-D-erythritol 2,4-cyclodiphosphate synthase [Porphyromonas catoniae]EWC92448.1 2-C-methyl-D-erythritol 2,4-cyclodiphosphate synthase [Porphyromonas catoniae ATCC 51270]